MLVFTYGSLMPGGWETEFGCVRHQLAELPNYRRVFNKASIQNWGTKNQPCPTVNLERAELASCHGVAFEFPIDQKHKVLAYLAGREGKDFAIRELPIRLAGGYELMAFVPLYEGENIIGPMTTSETASMVTEAHGICGSCTSYLNRIATKLAELRIDDPIVSELHKAVKDRRIL